MGFLSDFAGGATSTVMGGWDALTGQGEQKAKNKEVQKAAPRDADQQLMWNDFFKSLYGNSLNSYAGKDGSYDEYLNKFIDKNPDIMSILGVDPANVSDADRKKVADYYAQNYNTPSYRERLTQDTGYKQDNDQQLLSAILDTNSQTRDNNQQHYGSLQELVDQNRDMAGQRFSVGGLGISSPLVGTTRSGRDARDYVTEQLGALNQLANANAALNTSGAQAVNQYRNAYTPNRVENEYMNYIQGLASEQDKLRYGIPSTASTGTYDAPTNVLAGVGQVADIFGSLMPKQ